MIPGPVILLANGDFPSHPKPLQLLKDAVSTICCDGAINNLVKHKMEPTHIIGDMDSIEPALLEKFSNKIVEAWDQDENDLRKAISWLENKGVTKAVILGATGKREDHSLANIFTLLQYQTKLDLTIYTDYGIFSVLKGEQKFDSFTGQQVSLFSADKNIEITSTYLKYNFIRNKLSNLYYGTLNNSLNKKFSVSISHGKILVYQVFK